MINLNLICISLPSIPLRGNSKKNTNWTSEVITLTLLKTLILHSALSASLFKFEKPSSYRDSKHILSTPPFILKFFYLKHKVMILFVRTSSGILRNQVMWSEHNKLRGLVGHCWGFFLAPACACVDVLFQWFSDFPYFSSTKLIRSKMSSGEYQLHRDWMHKNNLS